MNRGRNNGQQKLILLVAAIVLLLILLVLGILEINRRDAARLKGYEDTASVVGVARAKQECLKEGLTSAVCDGITGNAVANECDGKPCWIVHVHSDDERTYWASVTIDNQNGNYVVIDYLRDTGMHR